MPDFRKCSLAQESKLGGEGAKESIASSRGPRRSCSWGRSVNGGFVELHRELTFVHVMLFPSPDGNVLSMRSLELQLYTSTRLFVANVAKSAAEAMQWAICR